VDGSVTHVSEQSHNRLSSQHCVCAVLLPCSWVGTWPRWRHPGGQQPGECVNTWSVCFRGLLHVSTWHALMIYVSVTKKACIPNLACFYSVDCMLLPW